MFKEFAENSKAIHFIKRYRKRYYVAENATANAYESSVFLKLKLTFYTTCERCYQASFLAKIIEEMKDMNVLANSKTVIIMKNLIGKFTQNTRQYAKESSFLLHSKRNTEKLYLGSFKQVSAIILVAVFVNILLMLTLKREVTFYGWTFRFLLLVISFCGLNYTGSLKNIFENSAFFKLINKSTNEKR